MRRSLVRPGVFLLLLSASLAFAQVPPSCSPSGRYTPVCGLHGPEDMELLPDKRHAIVSELPANMKRSDRPRVMLVDLVRHSARPLPIDIRPEPGWGEASCTAPPENFATHGIHLSKRRGERLQLLVVNHDERESIEAFEIRPTAQGARALWHGCANYREGIFNDVASHARADLTSYMTSGVDTGWVVEWTPENGFRRLPNSAVPMPGGVQLSPDGCFVYYTSWSGKDIRVYDRQQGVVVKQTKVNFYPDNISLASDGTFLIAGLNDIKQWEICSRQKAAFCNEVSSVIRLTPKSLAISNVLQLKAGVISGASVAIEGDSAHLSR